MQKRHACNFVLGIVLISALGTYILSPYAALHIIKSSILDQNFEKLWHYLDIEQIRESIKAQVRKTAVHKITRDEIIDQFAALALPADISHADSMIDLYLSREAIKNRFIKIDFMEYSNISYHTEYKSPNRLNLYLGLYLPAEDSTEATLSLQRRGFSGWQITNIQIDNTKLLKLAKLLKLEFTDEAENLSDYGFSTPEEDKKKMQRLQEEYLAEELYQQSLEYTNIYLILYEFSIKMHKTASKNTLPGIKFKIKNAGEKIVKSITVTVYFEDEKGSIIHEEIYSPVYASNIKSSRPLKPGYIWELEKDEFFPAKSVPSEWKVGAGYARITAIEFTNQD